MTLFYLYITPEPKIFLIPLRFSYILYIISHLGNPDTLICGNCREMFTDLGELLDHKRTYCKLRFTCKCQEVPVQLVNSTIICFNSFLSVINANFTQKLLFHQRISCVLYAKTRLWIRGIWWCMHKLHIWSTFTS